MEKLTSLEICAGAGGQALGLEQAGFSHVAAVEIDADAIETLKLNRDNDSLPPEQRWNVLHKDVHELDGSAYDGIDLFAGGVPCPPFSIAGKQLGQDDERDLFPKALELVESSHPKAVLLENVRGLAGPKFANYRAQIVRRLNHLGYEVIWQVILASEHGVPQLRPRFVLVALQREYAPYFWWPRPKGTPPTVGETLYELMAANGWPGASAWAARADSIGPTLVGGSKKHGGPDLGPTRAREGWAKLGVKGSSIAEEAPGEATPVDEMPRLTVRMAARIQGFPDSWEFYGRKTAAYRQVGNAFPPPVAKALGESIRAALLKDDELLSQAIASSEADGSISLSGPGTGVIRNIL
ncbi:DNA cytosine methyltransferase [Corynebacterium hindlerae]|uniref:Cytosine-specific methyltransferase n=1 Tax=Corynebacterium hindlerae TaxID=699041 RepID=A0A7G5FEK4_9CORY|nr:DNA cytosine methyltransferase [Corynebacterium hindlerae]QMV85045.1 DNA cytosine methyltransferase [Corynebacterium hindlerae]